MKYIITSQHVVCYTYDVNSLFPCYYYTVYYLITLCIKKTLNLNKTKISRIKKNQSKLCTFTLNRCKPKHIFSITNSQKSTSYTSVLA